MERPVHEPTVIRLSKKKKKKKKKKNIKKINKFKEMCFTWSIAGPASYSKKQENSVFFLIFI